LGDNEEYIDELYNHKEENLSSDESVASSYKYNHEDNDASMGYGEKVDDDHEDNDATMGDGEKVDGIMVKQVVLSEKCANTETMDGKDGIVAEGMFTVETNETVANKHTVINHLQSRHHGNDKEFL